MSKKPVAPRWPGDRAAKLLEYRRSIADEIAATMSPNFLELPDAVAPDHKLLLRQVENLPGVVSILQRHLVVLLAGRGYGARKIRQLIRDGARAADPEIVQLAALLLQRIDEAVHAADPKRRSMMLYGSRRTRRLDNLPPRSALLTPENIRKVIDDPKFKTRAAQAKQLRISERHLRRLLRKES